MVGLARAPGNGVASRSFALLALTAFAFDFPALSGRVVDQANIMSPVTRSDVEAKSKDLEDKSGIQLVVATVKSLQGSDIETYANQLFRFWKLGEAKKNNGVLLLVAPAEHKVRIEVGYGLEGTLTDALVARSSSPARSRRASRRTTSRRRHRARRRRHHRRAHHRRRRNGTARRRSDPTIRRWLSALCFRLCCWWW